VTPYWWWILVVPFGMALSRPMTGWEAFRMGSCSAGVVWLIGAGMAFATTSQIIAWRMASMFQLGNGWVVLAVTALLAMILGGISGAAGQSVGAQFSGKARSSRRRPDA
jgi:hypothetical protein